MSALRGDYFVNIKLYAPLLNRMLEPPYPLQKSHFDEFLFSKILFKWSKFKSCRSRDRFFVEFVPLRKIVGAMVL